MIRDGERRRIAGRDVVQVFARMVPEQKLRIVNALKPNNDVVAMTGDGVNAYRNRDGGRGTDVAREAACLVLLDDDFSSIVEAVRLGRRIYDNLVRSGEARAPEGSGARAMRTWGNGRPLSGSAKDGPQKLAGGGPSAR